MHVEHVSVPSIYICEDLPVSWGPALKALAFMDVTLDRVSVAESTSRGEEAVRREIV